MHAVKVCRSMGTARTDGAGRRRGTLTSAVRSLAAIDPRTDGRTWTTPNGYAAWPSTTTGLLTRPVHVAPGPGALDQKSLTLARLAALIAVGGAGASYGAQTDAAIGAGATTTEIVDVLVGVIPVVGLPRVVAAAPKLALALGYDIEEALQYQPGD